MDNPACSTVDVPSIHKTDHTSTTSLFDDSELALQCYQNKGVIVDDEEQDEPIRNKKRLSNVYNEVLLNILHSKSTWTDQDNSDNIMVENEDNENEENDAEIEENDNEEDGNDTLKMEEIRVSDGDSCNSNASSCLTFSDHYIKVGIIIHTCSVDRNDVNCD